ncbi:hypothetical protein CC1G_10332 [Coprinopsis cinerea okayama7|uniref:Uncharacterized protein n=1 Tax=Coprinopsis cinerea (strain Okayama-7 / 130 / ATCC MYA-4618 / FGSC 9003) TaxID=240176 RepID=A8P0K2_COPC7|nr:hypothetical protein CC1G_10332 [Coprinopsis cinerea okayama7\|eukprot:XP_001837911.1 hypothetical protein CC1G_10332 [Coprinopsis cinerea okayama7\
METRTKLSISTTLDSTLSTLSSPSSATPPSSSLDYAPTEITLSPLCPPNEIIAASRLDLYTEGETLQHWIKMVLDLRDASHVQKYNGESERALILIGRAARLATVGVPQHPDYETELRQHQFVHNWDRVVEEMVMEIKGYRLELLARWNRRQEDQRRAEEAKAKKAAKKRSTLLGIVSAHPRFIETRRRFTAGP